MNPEDARLEALRLATQQAGTPKEVTDRAEAYRAFLAVEPPKPAPTEVIREVEVVKEVQVFVDKESLEVIAFRNPQGDVVKGKPRDL
jgi:hypothetical protein